jgi:hypothetical protein
LIVASPISELVGERRSRSQTKFKQSSNLATT